MLAVAKNDSSALEFADTFWKTDKDILVYS